MRTALFKRDLGFYPILFGAWVLTVVALFGSRAQFGTPLPDVGASGNVSDEFRRQGIGATMALLQRSFARETEIKERAQIEESIGLAYFDLYRSDRNTLFLDSAEFHLEHASLTASDAAQCFYNLGRINAEKKNFAKARLLYEKTLELDPRNFMACHNLGYLCYYELQRPGEAKTYFQKAAQIDPTLPIENYMLAEISLEEKDPASAVRHYEKELALFSAAGTTRRFNFADNGSIGLAATLSAMQLAFLYANTLKRPPDALQMLDRYLQLETDPQRRQATLAELRKYGIEPGGGQTPRIPGQRP
jgi:tetratricopeptide (TPR) repeat protein